MPFPFAFAWLNAFQAVTHSHSLSDPCLCEATQANQNLLRLKILFGQRLKQKEIELQ
jgi:hypothetical protein